MYLTGMPAAGLPRFRIRPAPRTPIFALVAAAACVSAAQDGTDQGSKRSSAARPGQSWCWASVEYRAIECSGQTARRSGDTLYVRLAGGRDLPFVDDQTSEAPGGYHYVGRIPQPPLHVVQQYGHESPPSWIFVNERTGRSVVANDEPVISPDSSRFVTAAQPDWNNCTERDHPSLDVWRFTDTVPVLEWRFDPWNCRRQVGWGPTNPHWHGPDTLEFVGNEEIIRDTAAKEPIVQRRMWPVVAVHGRIGWRILTK
jgi:hypothetical protein